MRHLVLLFRDQDLSAAGQVAFSRRFGDLDLAPVDEYGRKHMEGFPEILVVSNVVEDGKPIGSLGSLESRWHTDMSYDERPPKASCLYSLNVAESGGETGYMDMYAAYQALPADLKQRIDGRTIKHDSVYTLDGYLRDGSGARLDRDRIDVAGIAGPSHPIARTHPETGRKALYFNRNRTDRILGMARRDSEALLDRIHAHMTQAKYQYHHPWRLGDILLWDNRCLIHAVNMDFPVGQRRLHQRTLLAGSAPA